MKNNSFKHFGPHGFKPVKKLVLTGLLAAVLSGPYVYQISSKDFNFEEMASTAPELSAAEKAKIDYEVDRDLLLEKLKKANPVKYGALTELPAASEIPEDLKTAAVAVEAKKVGLEAKRAESEREQRIKDAEKKRRDEIEAREKEAKEAKEVAEKAEKKKKEEASEAKRLDCNDKDKTASEKRDCREDAKREEKEKKTEEASKKFDERLEKAMDRCDKSSSRSKDSDEDKELSCKSKAFVDALKSRDKDLTSSAVNAQFRELLGKDLFAMLYSNDERDAERASIILSNIFNGKVPAQYAGLKRMIMDEVRRRADAPAKKVSAEFKKANQLPLNSTERTAQFTAAMAARSELESKIEAYSSSMLYPAQRANDQDAISYYKTSYTKGIESLLLKVMTGSSVVGGDSGGANRGGSTRGGTSTEARVVTAADGKMVHTGGVEYSLISPGTISNIHFGTPSSTRGSETRNGVRVNN